MDVPNNSGTALTIHIKYANCPIPTSNHSLRIIIAANQIKSSKKKNHFSSHKGITWNHFAGLHTGIHKKKKKST